jgi:hypothetical protein
MGVRSVVKEQRTYFSVLLLQRRLGCRSSSVVARRLSQMLFVPTANFHYLTCGSFWYPLLTVIAGPTVLHHEIQSCGPFGVSWSRRVTIKKQCSELVIAASMLKCFKPHTSSWNDHAAFAIALLGLGVDRNPQGMGKLPRHINKNTTCHLVAMCDIVPLSNLHVESFVMPDVHRF